jgi:predicted RNA methylase
MSKEKKPSEKPNKTPYQKPALNKFGSVKDMTRTYSKGSHTDGGAFPANKHMCITPPPVIEEHRILMNDVNGQDAYFKAIARNVKPGDVVLDLGTGTGLHALFACKAGARKVYAIESDTIINYAKKIAEKNGFQDRIEFIHGDSARVELPEKVDVIVSNIGFLSLVNALPDACERFLKPGGIVIPSSIAMNFSLAESKTLYQDRIQLWDKSQFDFDLSPMRELAVNHPLYHHFSNEELISESEEAQKIDLKTASDPNIYWTTSLTASRDGEIYGLASWYTFFDGQDELLSVRPPLKFHPELWNQILFPLDKALQVKKGETFEVEVSMHRTVSQEYPIWKWQISRNSQVLSRMSSSLTFSPHDLQ